MNYYPFHLGDYAAHTAHLEPMEDLAYRRMLDLYYRTEAPLSTDWRDVARLIRMKDQGAAIEAVLAEFFTLTDEGWRHSRCDGEIATFKAMAEGGRKGAAKRWGKPSDSPPIATPSHPQCQPEPKPEPEPKEKTARKRAAPAVLVSVDNLVEAGVEKQHATDWLAVRKVKNLPLTETAWAETQAEAIKAGLSIADAIRRAAAEGWAGFKASWLERAEGPRRQHDPPLTVPSTDHRADEFNASMREREATMTRPPAAILALAGKAVRTA